MSRFMVHFSDMLVGNEMNEIGIWKFHTDRIVTLSVENDMLKEQKVSSIKRSTSDKNKKENKNYLDHDYSQF